jgi:tetratricopeptide (TPR) repeat protein
MLRSGIVFIILCTCVSAAEPDTIEGALAHMYNQDYATAHEILNRVIAANPQDPLPYAFRASAYLFYELDRLGVLESEFLVDDKQIAEKKQKLLPDPQNREKFIRAVQDAEARAGGTLKVDPNDKDAIFAMCISEGVTTDYMAFVEKKQLSSLSVAKRSSGYAQHLLQLDPKFYDAYLTAGITEYMLGSLPFFVKWFVHFDNVSGSKTQGVDRLKLVSREGHYFRPFAKILLSIIALREKRPRDAHQYLTELAHDYPQNKLFRKELDKINAQMGANAN